MPTVASAMPDVIDALVALTPDVMPEGVTVYDGVGISEDPGGYLMIGVEDDPDNSEDSASTSAESSQSAATIGGTRQRDEAGQVTCAAMAWNGDADQKRARDDAFAIANAVAALCRQNPSLDLDQYPLMVTDYGTEQRLLQGQGENGAIAFVLFLVRFRAKL